MNVEFYTYYHSFAQGNFWRNMICIIMHFWNESEVTTIQRISLVFTMNWAYSKCGSQALIIKFHRISRIGRNKF